MVIYMQERLAAETANAKCSNYGDEIMNSNWNPAVVDLARDASQHTDNPELPDDLSTVDVEAFLDRIYALATQI